MVHYKLHYFDSRGWAEPIRLILQYAGQKYYEERYSIPDWETYWPEKKKAFPYEKVPVLEVDGKQLAECYAIARFLALQYDLAGRDAWERAKVDEIADFHKDVAREIAPYFQTKRGYREGDAAKLRESVFLPALEKYFPFFLKRLQESGSGYFVKSGITWVDFLVADYLTNVVIHGDGVLESQFPNLEEYRQRILRNPKIKDYISSRKQSDI
ncbi:putative glutathione S-transferase 5 [Ditylenchus destructor]|uniref:glutathione transferase n=1 Tax=Ditylenchus destructor TaxID=166010 RepID=A0AAD4N321_9BILA|nr:putative glutathione S-transferase 5 [Ditylenchus destructor]